MALETSDIQNKLVDNFQLIATNFEQQHDIFTFEVDSESIIDERQLGAMLSSMLSEQSWMVSSLE